MSSKYFISQLRIGKHHLDAMPQQYVGRCNEGNTHSIQSQDWTLQGQSGDRDNNFTLKQRDHSEKTTSL